MPGHIDESDGLASAGRQIGEAEIDRNATRLFLLQTVGIDAGQVGEAGSKTAVLAINPPPAKEGGEIIEDADSDVDGAVARIVSFLEERKLI